MKKQIKSLDSLKDSRILYDKNPPTFGYLLILIVGIFWGLTLVWSVYTPKIYTIQSQGVVTNEDANYVMCSYTGKIDTCYMEEGALVEQGDLLFTVKSTDYDLQEEQLLKNKQIYEKQVSQYEILVKSIKDDINYFDESNPDDSLYYNTFEAYKAKIAQNTLDVSTYKAYGYTQKQIEIELEKNQGKISEVYYTAIQSADNSIQEAKAQIATINSQLSAIKHGQNTYQVKATASGVLHLLGNYKKGVVVQTTTTVATITPENSSRVIESYVSTSDMARMQEGDKVQIVVDGLSQSVYGTISGKVKHIDSNVTSQENSDGSMSQVFRVLVDMDSDYMVSQEGDKVDVVNGMTATARIQYDKVTYFNYVLEKLGFKAR